MHKLRVKELLIRSKIILIILAIGIYLSIVSKYFLTYRNITNIFVSISYEGIIVVGMAILIILGEIDLSVGAMMAFGSVLAIIFQPYGVVAGVLAGIIGSGLIGLLNGYLVTKLQIPSIAATLGSMIFLKGVVYALTGEHTISGTNQNFLIISDINIFGISLSAIIFILIVILFEIILQKTFFGRAIFSIGGNSTASRFFGIKVDKTRILCFMITGILSGLAGVLLAGKLNVASGNIGLSSNVLVITAVLLGGISMDGGEGSILKAFQGILLLGIINNAMVILKIPSFSQEIIRGLLLILLIVINSINNERKKYL